jgi:hypothetical protein
MVVVDCLLALPMACVGPRIKWLPISGLRAEQSFVFVKIWPDIMNTRSFLRPEGAVYSFIYTD